MTSVAVAFLVGLGAAAAPPPLTGLYSVGELGFVEFQLQEGRVVGKYKAGGACEFAADTQIVSGAFEGLVFTGTVTVCQVGQGCEPKRSLPLLALWHEDQLSGQLRLDPGCKSPAFDTKAIVFTPATLEEKQRLLNDNGSSATAIAAKNTPKKDPGVLAREALNDGLRLFNSGRYPEAVKAFRTVLANDTESFYGEQGLGAALTKTKNASEGIKHLQAALELAPRSKVSNEQVADVHFNLGCAHSQLGRKKESIAALKLAVKLGAPGQFVHELDTDEDLAPVRAEPEFRKLAGDARLAAPKKKPK